jgi:hypothetical protein
MRLDLDQLSGSRATLSIPGGRVELSRLEVGRLEMQRPGAEPTRLALGGVNLAALVRLRGTRLRLAAEGAALAALSLGPEVRLEGLALPQLSITDLTLTLPATCPMIQLSGCTGTIDLSPAWAVERLGVDSVSLRRPAATLGLGGEIDLELHQDDQTSISDLELRGLSFANEARGRVAAGSIDVPGLTLTQGAHSIRADLGVEGVNVALGGGGVSAGAALARLAEVNGTGFKLAGLEGRGIKLERSPDGGLALSAAEVTLSGLELRLGSATLRLERVSLARGFALADRELTIPDLAFEQATVEIDPIELGQGGGGKIDLPFLDALNGRVHADITMDVTAPVLGRRRATHPVRLTIESGTIDFKQLERDLALLENTVLDFEVEGDTLILEKDLPLVPFDNTTLVSWHLPDDEERVLARRNRVRLRRLLDFRIAEDDDHAVDVELHRLELSDIDLSLNLDGLAVIALGSAGEVHLGGDERPGVLELNATGALCHDAATEAQTEIRLTLREINGRLPSFSVGGATVRSGDFKLSAVEQARVAFSGFVPSRARLVVGRGSIGALRIGLPGPE